VASYKPLGSSNAALVARGKELANYAFVRLGTSGTSYELLLDDWRAQASSLGEDFDSYSQIPVAIFEEIMEKDKERTGLFVLKSQEDYGAVCMLNHADIPNYDGPVLRVRHILFSPKFDLGDLPVTDYSEALVTILVNVISLAQSDPKLMANHIKFHARSPADMQFFALLGRALDGSGAFASVQHRGTWLYITLK
jgi:hypothetical protein